MPVLVQSTRTGPPAWDTLVWARLMRMANAYWNYAPYTVVTCAYPTPSSAPNPSTEFLGGTLDPSTAWHQLDLILIRRPLMRDVHHTRTYHSADCDTDHSLVSCKIRLKPKKFHRAQKAGKLRINAVKMRCTDLIQQFSTSFTDKLSTLSAAETAELVQLEHVERSNP